MTVLPNKMSELIKVALEDLKKIEKDPRYIVDMGEWHEGQYYGNGCHVCAAGAVMAQTMELPIGESISPGDFDWEIRSKLRAIDCLRTGNIDRAACELNIPFEYNVRDREIPEYGRDRDGFFNQLEELINELEEKGL